MNQRLDIYDIFPSGMTEYLSRYGWHFSKNMCEWAVSRMKAENKATGKKEEIKALSKEDVEVILTQAGVKLEKAKGYDHVFVANMGSPTILNHRFPTIPIWLCL